MIFIVVFFLVKYGRSIPLTEDWLLVPAVTGNERQLLPWLWEQNNEHRVPFPKLLLFLLLQAADGDFRVGMILDILIIGALAATMILVARHVRGGHTTYADAIFPVVLLHLGNAENLLWSWQMTVVLPTVAACIILLVLIGDPALTKPIPVILAAISLVSLPLSGLNGIIYTPILGVWLGYRGFLHCRRRHQNARLSVGILLLISAIVAVGVTCLYFVGYQRPAWAPRPADLIAWIAATLKFLALGFGPAATGSWFLFAGVAVILVASGIVLTVRSLSQTGPDRLRAGGVLAFLGATVVFALGVGWGREASIAIFGKWPLRYSLFSAPALCAALFAWELYGPRTMRRWVQGSLLIIVCLLLPLNTMRGLAWINWLHERDNQLLNDLISGASASTLAVQHRHLLHHNMDVGRLADYIRMLKDAGHEPFAQLAKQNAPEGDQAGTTLRPTQHDTQLFQVPNDTSLVTQEIIYTMPEAITVYLVWGLNGWSIAPVELRPTDTTLRPGGPKHKPLMHTPMMRAGDTFTVTLLVPAGMTLDYGFLITETKGLLDIDSPRWAGGYQTKPMNHRVVEIRPAMRDRLAIFDVFRDLSDVLVHGRYIVAGITAFLTCWFLLFLLIPLVGGPGH